MLTIHLIVALSGAASAASTWRLSDYINAGIDLASEITAPQQISLGTGNSTAAGSSANANPTSNEPCALVAAQQAAGNQYLNATLANECLWSVPINSTGAALQLQGVEFFLEFQSTLAYLADPPLGYLYPAVDLLDGILQISDLLSNGSYVSEYHFQTDISNLLASAYDGHLAYFSDIASIFAFIHEDHFVSVSADGFAIPDVYLYSDLQWLLNNNGSISDGLISPVTQVMGLDVQLYLNQLAVVVGGAQDPDANYNTAVSQGYTASTIYMAEADEITFANGSVGVIQAVAATSVNLTGVVDGQSFFDLLLANSTTAQQAANSQTPDYPGTFTTEIPFQPVQTYTANPTDFEPIVMTADNASLAGFFVPGLKDFAVLKIASFEPQGNESTNDPVIDFSDRVREFLATSKAANKSKLLIDLSDNPGGDIALGFDLFAQLFPHITPDGVTNMRAVEMFNEVGQVVSANFSTYTDANAPQSPCNNLFTTPFEYATEYRPNGPAYTSWSDFYGPIEHYGDNFTYPSRINFENSTLGLDCVPISNYDGLKNITPAVFETQNVVILTNGVCHSTCAAFAEYMKTQAKVPSIAIGGRAQFGPMQAIGGVKGAQTYQWQDWYTDISLAANLNQTSAVYTAMNATLTDVTPGIQQALLRTTGASFNLRNNLRPGDETAMPLQFVYQAADCRLFYTALSAMHGAETWIQAYTARWIKGICVANSTGHPSALPDSDLLITPPDSAFNFFGADPTALNPFAGSS